MEVYFKLFTQQYIHLSQAFSPITLCLTVIATLFSILKLLKSLTGLSKTSLIPKLPSVPLLGPFYPLIWKKINKLFVSWVSSYGCTFRTSIMGTEVVLLSNPKWLQKLLTSTDPGHMAKYPLIYNLLFPSVLKEGLLSLSNIPKWKNHRSILSKAFSLESLKADLAVFNRHGKQLINKMSNTSFEDDFNNSKKGNDDNTLHARLRESTYHTTGEIFVGLNNLSKEEELEIHEKISRCQDIISYRLYHPWCLPELIWNLFPQKKEMDMLANSITTTFENLVQTARDNREPNKSMKTLIDLMIEAGLGNKEIVSELGNFAIAAYDTQSTGLNYFFFVIALHPEYQAECRKEIDEVFESKSENYDLSIEDLAQMKYLEMCIKESLRMFTPIHAFARELNSPIKLDDNLVLDKGTVVFVSPALIHRDPQVFPDPTVYNPERFLPENCKARNVYSYIPFSKGPRDCIGQRLAMVHLKLVAAYILRNYELYPGNPDDNLSKVWDTVIWPTKDLGVRWRKRT